MHYYKRNIGDYHTKAGRLSILQHGVYMLLIDSCYDRETFPTESEAIDWCWACSQDEVEAVKFVLNRFFTMTESGTFEQKRIAQEIQEYVGRCAANTIIGKKGGRPKGSKGKARKTETVNLKSETVNLKTESNPNGSKIKPKPLTTNQEPLTTNHIKTLGQSAIDPMFDQFWKSGMRKVNRKAALSLFTSILKKQKDGNQFVRMLVADISNRLANQQLGFAEMHPTTYLNGERWTDETSKPHSGAIRRPSVAKRSEDDARQALALIEATEASERALGPHVSAVQIEVGYGRGGDHREREIHGEFLALVQEDGRSQ